jgi:hypothetical protein
MQKQQLRQIVVEGRWEMHFDYRNPAGRKTITFLENGHIGEGRNQNETTWRLENEELTVVRATGALQNRFAYDPSRQLFFSISDASAEGLPNQTIKLHHA